MKAYVVPAPGIHLEEDELIEFCASRLARYKCPSKVMFVDELPRSTGTGRSCCAGSPQVAGSRCGAARDGLGVPPPRTRRRREEAGEDDVIPTRSVTANALMASNTELSTPLAPSTRVPTRSARWRHRSGVAGCSTPPRPGSRAAPAGGAHRRPGPGAAPRTPSTPAPACRRGWAPGTARSPPPRRRTPRRARRHGATRSPTRAPHSR